LTKICSRAVRETRIRAEGRDTERVSTTPPSGARVLIIEDETTLAGMIAAYMSRAGYDSSVVHTGPDGVQAARDLAPDVVILDLGLPGLDGIEVCRQLRTFTDCYVIVVTARKDEIELVARVQAVLRRPRTGSTTASGTARSEPTRVFGALRVDPDGQRVHLRDVEVALTPTERDLLMALTRRPSMAFSRRQLIDDIWGPDWVGDEHLVDVHVAHLRRKLGDDPETGRYITTVRGVGYRMGQG
jgi:DNA-binding response OmpR family regulator